MNSSSFFFPTKKIVGDTHDGFHYLEAAGFATQTAKGCIALLPLGQRVVMKIEALVRRACEKRGFAEMRLPILQNEALWHESGRFAEYEEVLCCTTLHSEQKFVINPTQEESVAHVVRMSRVPSENYPLRFFQISERVRNEMRPASDLVKSRSFLLADLYSFCLTKDEMYREQSQLQGIIEEVTSSLGMLVHSAIHLPRKGLPVYSFWTESVSNQCKVQFCPDCLDSYRIHGEAMPCPRCEVEFETVTGAELADVAGNSTLLAKMGVVTLDAKPVYGFSFAGIGISRMLQLIAEHNHDERGLVWPLRVSPFLVHIVSSPERRSEALELEKILSNENVEVLTDNRSLPFVRQLVDADLIGIPFQIVLGSKTKPGCVEIVSRHEQKVRTVRANTSEVGTTLTSLVAERGIYER